MWNAMESGSDGMTKSEGGPAFTSRRNALKGLALTAMASSLVHASTSESSGTSAESNYRNAAPATGSVVRASSSSPIVETEYGRVRGYTRKGIHIFKGIPYAADAGSVNRFLPAKMPTPWAGVRPSLYPSHVCPQPSFTTNSGDEALWLFMWDEGVRKEDCLSLNVWSPGLDNAKRPVMVWLHGGAYTMGSSTESPSYDGENLARNGDVVMVSLNHRLGIFGFLNLEEYGEEYAASGANGMLDIVAALQWVRTNIAAFGGDPNRVMVFGQSGGGMKVTTLLTMPPAKGLFHRAAIHSGSLLGAVTREHSLEMTAALMKKLDVAGKDLRKLQQIPAEQLLQAATTVSTIRGPVGRAGIGNWGASSELLQSWAPVAGNSAIPDQPFNPRAPECSADVPMIVGTTLNEFVNGVDNPDCFKMSDEELHEKVQKAFPHRAAAILQAYRKQLKRTNNFEVWSVIAASSARAMSLRQARLKTEQKAAPAYCYRFDWHTPVLDGRPMAQHGMDLAFFFDNTAKFENMTGDGPEARLLASRMSRAWIRFAHSGNPNHAGIPQWKPFNSSTNGTMLWDNECVFRENLDDECVKLTSD
jgi:para-nitrobenzyl esterase